MGFHSISFFFILSENMGKPATYQLGFKWQYLLRPEVALAFLVFKVLGRLFVIVKELGTRAIEQITGFDRHGNKMKRRRRRRRGSCPMIVEDFSWQCSDLMDGEDCALVDYDSYEFMA